LLAVLGEIQFEVVGSPEAAGGARRADGVLMRAGISARSLAALLLIGQELRNLRPKPPQVDDHCRDDDPAQRIKFGPKLVRKIENYTESYQRPKDAHQGMEHQERVELKAPSKSQRRSIVCGTKQDLILAEILARGIPCFLKLAAHPRKIGEQVVLQAHHNELDQKLADAWKRQAVREERTAY
jgi:hypothetical protein